MVDPIALPTWVFGREHVAVPFGHRDHPPRIHWAEGWENQQETLAFFHILYWLVVQSPSWKIWKSMGRIYPISEMENKTCLKPPTRSNQIQPVYHPMIGLKQLVIGAYSIDIWSAVRARNDVVFYEDSCCLHERMIILGVVDVSWNMTG